MSILEKVIGNIPDPPPRQTKGIILTEIFDEIDQIKSRYEYKAPVRFYGINQYPKKYVDKILSSIKVIDQEGEIYTRTDKYADVWTGPRFTRWSTSRLLSTKKVRVDNGV